MRLSSFISLFKQAGIFEFPPKMYAVITPWVNQIVASHYLSLAEELLEGKRQDLHKFDVKKDAYDLFEYFRKEIMRNIELGRVNPEKFLDLVYPISYELNFVGSLLVVALGEDKYHVGFIPKKEIATLTPEDLKRHGEKINGKFEIDKKDIPKALEAAIDKGKKAIDEAAAGGVTRFEEIDIVELNLLKKECLTYTNKPKLCKTKMVKQFKVDLSGWKYLPKEIKIELAKEWKPRLEAMNRSFNFLVSQMKGLKDQEKTIKVPWYYPSGRKITYEIKAVLRTYLGKEPKLSYLLLEDGGYGGEYDTLDEVKLHLENNLVQVEKSADMRTFEYKDIDEFLTQNNLDSITVVLNCKPHVKRRGQWNPNNKEIQIDLGFSVIAGVKEFHDTLLGAHGTLKHELQHLGQTYLSILKRIPNIGFPSPKMRSPRLPQEHLEHPLRDIEFQTDLKNSITDFRKRIVEENPKERKKFFEEFIGLKITDKTHQFFSAWKQYAPEKWKVAVKELLKAI